MVQVLVNQKTRKKHILNEESNQILCNTNMVYHNGYVQEIEEPREDSLVCRNCIKIMEGRCFE